MKYLHSISLRLLLSLILAVLPVLFAKADGCCPDANRDCHMNNMAGFCAQCIPTAITSTAVPLLVMSTKVTPEFAQHLYRYPHIDPIWRPPASLLNNH